MTNLKNIVVFSLFVGFVSCETKPTSIGISQQHTDTLTFEVKNYITFKKKSHHFLYSYTFPLVKVPNSVYNYSGILFKEIIFDNDLCRDCFIKDVHPYESRLLNRYYCDTSSYKEAILFNTGSFFYKMDSANYAYKHQFTNRIPTLFPFLRYLRNELRDYRDSIVDHAEFIVPYLENGNSLFSYHNLKTIIYKKENLYLKMMYVKKGLKRSEIWPSIQHFKKNNHCKRLDPGNKSE